VSSRLHIPAALATVVAALALAALAGSAGASHSSSPVRASTGTAGGNGAFASLFQGASADGTRVFIRTEEALEPTDTDIYFDLYERAGGVTSQISTGPAGGNGFYTSSFRGASDDGTRVFFTTEEPLVAGDSDLGCETQDGVSSPCVDLYERSGATTTLLSTGPAGGNGSFHAGFEGNSADGARVLFSTREQLVAADTDSAGDIYERSGGSTTLVSTGPAGGNGSFEAHYRGTSDDGARVFFETEESLVASDTDSAGDIYERSGGTTTLLSTGPDGGNGSQGASFRGASSDGSRVFVETEETLVASDTDSSVDVYERSGGSTTLASTGPAGGNGSADALFDGASDGGTRVFFQTAGQLVGGDTDSERDVYERSSGTTTLLSTGPAGGNGAQEAVFEGASADGSRAFVGTREALTTSDTDGSFDLYERSAGTTTLLSTGPTGGNGAYDAFFRDVSTDGGRVFFETQESLEAADTDALPDVYERSSGGTTRISTGTGGGNGTSVPTLVGAAEDGSRVFVGTGESLESGDTDTSTDIYVSSVSSSYVRPKGATPLQISLVLAYGPCTAPNRVHGPGLAYPSCAPPAMESDQLTVGTFDANAKPVKSVGSVRLDTIVGNPSTPADEADVEVHLNVTDVRRLSDLEDYTGELRARFSMRITDRYNGSVPVDPGTVSSVYGGFAVPCAATVDTGIGSTCSVTTTADSLVPGLVREGDRAIWELGQFEVYDGGPDSLANTLPNTPFLRQGLFVP
jgi:hypothetical protein